MKQNTQKNKIKTIIANILGVKQQLWNSPKKFPTSIKPIIIKHPQGIIIGYFDNGDYFTTENGVYELLKCLAWTEYPSNNCLLNE